MKVKVFQTTQEMGAAAAKHAAEVLNKHIANGENPRLLLSTGMSQFVFFENLAKENVDWSKVEMFHLDEYVGMSPEHPASFQKYLRERFVNVVHPGAYHLIDGTRDPQETIAELTALLNERPIDLGMIGIGENGHIAFNDPPAVFDDPATYKVVDLVPSCIQQQIREGWFTSEEDAFKQALTMTCSKIMECKTIVSVVPYAVKAQAVHDTLTMEETNMVPATLMKRHPNITMYCDADAASMVPQEVLDSFR